MAGLCDRFLVRADKLHISEKLSFEQLALVETLAIGCHATDRGDPKEGDHVLIIGAGPIGLATLEFTRLTGATITVMDMVESRLEFCKNRYGIENTVVFKGDGSELDKMREITGGDLYEIVTDATGVNKSMSNALSYVAHSGTLVYLGITTQEITFLHPALHRPEMTIKGSRYALPKDFPRIIGLIEDGTIDTVSLDHAPYAVRRRRSQLRVLHKPCFRCHQGRHRSQRLAHGRQRLAYGGNDLAHDSIRGHD